MTTTTTPDILDDIAAETERYEGSQDGRVRTLLDAITSTHRRVNRGQMSVSEGNATLEQLRAELRDAWTLSGE